MINIARVVGETQFTSTNIRTFYATLAPGSVPLTHFTHRSCYIMPAARAYLQISLGKTRSAPTCMHELMTSHVTVKDHVTP